MIKIILIAGSLAAMFIFLLILFLCKVAGESDGKIEVMMRSMTSEEFEDYISKRS